MWVFASRLFPPQGDHRIYPCRAAGWHVARRQRHTEQQERYTHEGHRVGGCDAEEETPDRTRER